MLLFLDESISHASSDLYKMLLTAKHDIDLFMSAIGLQSSDHVMMLIGYAVLVIFSVKTIANIYYAITGWIYIISRGKTQWFSQRNRILQRVAFEQWCHDRGIVNFEITASGKYEATGVQGQWEAWQYAETHSHSALMLEALNQCSVQDWYLYDEAEAVYDRISEEKS